MKTIVLVLSMIFTSIVAQERNCEFGEYFVPKQCENMKSNNDCFDHYYDFYREIRMQSGNFRCSKAVSTKLRVLSLLIYHLPVSDF